MMPPTIEKKPIAAIPPLAATMVYMVLGWSGVENRLLRSLNMVEASKTPTAALPREAVQEADLKYFPQKSEKGVTLELICNQSFINIIIPSSSSFSIAIPISIVSLIGFSSLVRPALDLPVSMETQTAKRLDNHAQQLKQLQSDVSDIKSFLLVLEADRAESSEFRQVVLAWMNNQEKSKRDGSSDSGPFSGIFYSSGSNSTSIDRPPTLPWAVQKVQLPDFDGYDPQGWLQQANHYFDFHNISDELRLLFVQFRMVGVAQHWFTAISQIWESMTWPEFQSELLQRFGSFAIPHPSEQFVPIQQSKVISDCLEDVVDTRCPNSATSKAATSLFSYQHNFGPLPIDGPQVLGQGEPKWVHTPQLTKQRISVCSFERIIIKLRKGYLVHVHEWDMGLQKDIQCSFPVIRLGVSSTPELGHVLRHDHGVLYPSRLDWKGRKKKRICLRWGNRYGPAHKCPDERIKSTFHG
ncbi:hypothetical protein E3N88_16220 [Mikania micrantha]|uniref:Retrotransposon gag domain-containing protein n=1 Tax=Mikania micrantha TaxID=192012 RepID=A0A5N6NXN2_9ASTR|nr:hypothetical protein E3N88_16220 [Mikania micrantha]